jgi:hypothetical protein
MIAHQAPAMDLPIRFASRFSQRLEKELAILVRSKNRLAMIASVHNMINRAGILHPDFPCHWPDNAALQEAVKVNNTILRTDRH